MDDRHDNQNPIQMCTRNSEEGSSSEDAEPSIERVKASEVDDGILLEDDDDDDDDDSGDDGGDEAELDVREGSIEISADPSTIQVSPCVSTTHNSTQTDASESTNKKTSTELKDVNSGKPKGSSNHETCTELKDLTLTSPRAVACIDLNTGIEVEVNPIQKQDTREKNYIMRKHQSPGKLHRKRHSVYQHDTPIPRVISFVPTLDLPLSSTQSSDIGHLYNIAAKSSDYNAHRRERERAPITKKPARNKSAPVYERLYNDSRDRQSEGRRRRMEIAQRRR